MASCCIPSAVSLGKRSQSFPCCQFVEQLLEMLCKVTAWSIAMWAMNQLPALTPSLLNGSWNKEKWRERNKTHPDPSKWEMRGRRDRRSREAIPSLSAFANNITWWYEDHNVVVGIMSEFSSVYFLFHHSSLSQLPNGKCRKKKDAVSILMFLDVNSSPQCCKTTTFLPASLGVRGPPLESVFPPFCCVVRSSLSLGLKHLCILLTWTTNPLFGGIMEGHFGFKSLSVLITLSQIWAKVSSDLGFCTKFWYRLFICWKSVYVIKFPCNLLLHWQSQSLPVKKPWTMSQRFPGQQ